MINRRQLLAASAAGLAVASPLRAAAQVTTKPVRVIVGFPAGGGTDVIARIVADRLRGAYSPTVLVENKPGAAARLSVEFVKSSEPDGTTMLFTPDFPITVYPFSFKKLSYDPLRDLIPVATSTQGMLTYNVGPGVPESVKTMKDFVAWCKANPEKASYGTTSAGGTPHFVGVMVANAAGIKMTPVHYRGGAPAVQDLMGGHVPATINPTSEVIELYKAGKIRILAVTGSKRSAFLPDVPTIRESGYDVVNDSWIGTLVAAGTPPEVVRQLDKAIEVASKSPELKESLAKFGNEPGYMGTEEFTARVKADLVRWEAIVKESGFVAED
jgi:tripartite-type tricarboxylate transporter receptor subunit TctC